MVKGRNHLCLLSVCSIVRKWPSWFRAQQSPQPVDMSQSDGGYQLVAVKWRVCKHYTPVYKNKLLQVKDSEGSRGRKNRPSSAVLWSAWVSGVTSVRWKERLRSVASTEGWKGQEVAPAQTPDSLFKFKVTVFIQLSPPPPSSDKLLFLKGS